MSQGTQIVLALTLVAFHASAATPQRVVPVNPAARTMAEEIGALRADALKAYEAGAYKVYLKSVEELSARLPNHPEVAMRLAAAQARNGLGKEALATLDAVAGMGVTVDFDADPRNAEDFKSVASTPEFQKWRTQVKANAEPRNASKPWHTFTDANLLPEDVTYSAKEKAFYVSSVLQHKVIRIDGDRRESAFPLESPEKGWNVLGLAADPKRGVLWVSAQAMRGFPGIADADAGKSRLSVYGLKSRKRLYSHEFKPHDDKQAAVADIALAPNGDLVAADSEQARLYRVGANRRFMDALDRPFFSPQDIAVRDQIAYVADYARGIARVNLATGEQRWLKADRNVALNGIDGLYLHGDGLLAVQNGTRPARIAWFALNAEETHIVRCDVLERGAEVLGEPTHGVIVGDEFVYLANTGWNKVDERGAPKANEKLTPASLRKLRLTAPKTAKVKAVAKGVSLLRGELVAGRQPDGNTVVFDVPAGLVVMDTGRHPEHARAIIDFSQQRGKPVAAIVNSHWHLDHVGGNVALRRSFPGVRVHGSDAISHALRGFLARYRTQLQDSLKGDAPETRKQEWRAELARIDSGRALTPDVIVKESGRRVIGGKEFRVGLERRAVTAGDVWLLDPATKTLAAGDLVTLPVPLFDTACTSGWVTALEHLAAAKFERLIPGHGAPMTRAQFKTWQVAFGNLVDCSTSPKPGDACVAGWLNDVGPLVAPGERELATSMLGSYLTSHLRAKGNADNCAA
jgi:glyoxylase-like metal-dependent hydrolase (beta-lactamase superfamily II)